MSLYIRTLNESDEQYVEYIDSLADFSVAQSLDCEGYAWGIFENNRLIGYCTIGGADDFYHFEVYPGWNPNCLLLSDVFILPEYRRKGLASKLVSEAINMHEESKDNHIFLELLDSDLENLYSKLGFKTFISDSAGAVAMVKKTNENSPSLV